MMACIFCGLTYIRFISFHKVISQVSQRCKTEKNKALLGILQHFPLKVCRFFIKNKYSLLYMLWA